ncbi:MAG: flavodoxin family protein [Clostridia bacterium]|nr:flavodoxin family protein [Clostridia bacterium]
MKILVLNGSPKIQSDTMRMTKSFLDGLSENTECEITIIDVIKKNIKPCTGCFMCWKNGDGKCVQKDDQNEILSKILESDVILWSFPLYCYSMPSHLKAVVDRLIPLCRLTMREENGCISHELLFDLSRKKYIVFSGSGFPNWEGNFEGLRLQMINNFGNPIMVFVPETPLLNIPEAAPVAQMLLEKFRSAGEEFARTDTLLPETIRALETPMIPKEAYLARTNASM